MKLPSGAELVITVAPFIDSRALYQSILKEMKHLKMEAKTELNTNFVKDIFCSLLSSKEVEVALDTCMKRCTYKGLKIDDDTFESIDARGDYLLVCVEVAKENILPFMKSLYAEYAPMWEKLKSNLA